MVVAKFLLLLSFLVLTWLFRGFKEKTYEICTYTVTLGGEWNEMKLIQTDQYKYQWDLFALLFIWIKSPWPSTGEMIFWANHQEQDEVMDVLTSPFEAPETTWRNGRPNQTYKFSGRGEDWSSRLDFTNSLFLNPPAFTRIDGTAAGEWWIGQGPGDSFQDTFNFFFDLTSFDKPCHSFASLGWTPSRPFCPHQSHLLSKG